MGNPSATDWVRLEVLILRKACSILRNQFRSRWKRTQNCEWVDSTHFGRQFAEGLGAKVYQSFGRLHKMLMEDGQVNTWDFTMLSRILQQVDFTSNNSVKFSSEDVQQLQIESQKIDELVEWSRKAIDYPVKVMEDEQFSQLWTNIEKVLISFGESEKELEQLRKTQSTSEQDLLRLVSQDAPPTDQATVQKAAKLKEEAKQAINSRGDIEAAIHCLNSAIDLGHENLPNVELGALYSARSDAYLRKALGTAQREIRQDMAYLALKDAKLALSLRPAWGLAYYRVGTAYVELNKLKKASKYLDKALDLEPTAEEIQVAHKNCKVKLVKLSDNFAPELKTFQKPDRSVQQWGTRLSPEVKDQVELIFFADDESNILGDIYRAHKLRDGTGSSRPDFRGAAALYRKGVKFRNAEAMYNLALLKLEGQGVRQDVKGALELLKRAAKQPSKLPRSSYCGSYSSNVGVVESAFLLGLLTAQGINFPPQRDLFSASVWFLEASEHGSGVAAYNMGCCYFDGKGVAKSEKKALQQWKLAASRKVPEAMLALAIHHGREWETQEARRWCEQAMQEEARDYLNFGRFEGGLESSKGSCFWSSAQLTQFSNALDQMEEWRRRYGQKEVSAWEASQGYTPGRNMHQNLTMRQRLIRMLYGLREEHEKIAEVQEFLGSLRARPLSIPLPKAQSWVEALRRAIYLGGREGSVTTDDESTRSPSSNEGSVGSDN